MPNRYITSEVNDSSYHGVNGRAPFLRKLTDDVINCNHLQLFTVFSLGTKYHSSQFALGLNYGFVWFGF